MRYYHIDEIDSKDMKKIEKKLGNTLQAGGIPGVYYVPVPESMLTAEQKEHLSECGPYIMAIETEEDHLRMELLVRAQGRLRCKCLAYASPELRNHAIEYLDALIRDLDIAV